MVKWSRIFQLDGANAHRLAEEARRRTAHNPSIPQYLPTSLTSLAVIPIRESAIDTPYDPAEVTKVALRLRHLLCEVIPCELEEDRITRPHSRIITPAVLQAAREAGDSKYRDCVVYCLLVNKAWFRAQAKIEIWDAELHNLRAVGAEVVAKALIEAEEDTEYLMHRLLLQRYCYLANGEPTAVANVIEKAVDLHALRVISSSGYQRTVRYLWKGWLTQSEDDPTRFVDYVNKADTGYWIHVNPDRMRAPVYQNIMQIFFSIVYLALYTGAINTVNKTGELDATEWLLYLFTAGFIADEMTKFWKVGRYYIGFWNVFNLILHGLLCTSFILRVIGLANPLDSPERDRYDTLSYNFLAFSAPMFWMRLLLFLDTFRFFGAMLVILKVMMQESIIFFALLAVVMVGFLQAFIGLDNADNHADSRRFVLQAMANAVMQSPDFSGFETFAHPFGLVLYYVFTFVVMVILLNVLIALYNSAYEDITGRALEEYMALFAQKTMQFVRPPDEHVFLAPLNLVELTCLILPFEWWLPRPMYAQLSDFVMAVLYAPLLFVAAFVEQRSAQEVRSNRKRGDLDDDTVEEWEQMAGEVDFGAEGWTDKVDRSKSNVDDEPAAIEVRELRKEVLELKKLLLKEKGRGGDGDNGGEDGDAQPGSRTSRDNVLE
jgi:hypothetical protein